MGSTFCQGQNGMEISFPYIPPNPTGPQMIQPGLCSTHRLEKQKMKAIILVIQVLSRAVQDIALKKAAVTTLEVFNLL